jgi:thymidylate synthase
MFERAYGNYLGLGRLLAYIANQADLSPGTLTVVAGHAHLDGPITAIRPLLSGTPILAA